ncbi:MAG: helix-turn-helix transcriptional regulator [Lachnospiraceae bacterium]|jgi:transcriptional regulator with XRE-family HTH domain|nr:helix-turn-helix transcriptional regulator [Lachnospiraceae bacterium]DAV74545.1 MAG TPA: repressor protein [Caudoviricetes sp.]
MAQFDKILRLLRGEKEMSQQELADALGISKSAINMYERGERQPNFETLEAIADFFNVDIDYLLGRTTKTTKIIKPQSDSGYYLNQDTAQYADFLLHHPEYQVLFDASRKVKPEDIEKALTALGLFSE